jgi:hypothetical protein
MLEFIREYLSDWMAILEVLSVTLLDHDTEHGLAGEVYLVKLVEGRPDHTSTIEFPTKKVERTCIVSAIEYNKWIRKQEIVKFID